MVTRARQLGHGNYNPPYMRGLSPPELGWLERVAKGARDAAGYALEVFQYPKNRRRQFTEIFDVEVAPHDAEIQNGAKFIDATQNRIQLYYDGALVNGEGGLYDVSYECRPHPTEVGYLEVFINGDWRRFKADAVMVPYIPQVVEVDKTLFELRTQKAKAEAELATIAAALEHNRTRDLGVRTSQGLLVDLWDVHGALFDSYNHSLRPEEAVQPIGIAEGELMEEKAIGEEAVQILKYPAVDDHLSRELFVVETMLAYLDATPAVDRERAIISDELLIEVGRQRPEFRTMAEEDVHEIQEEILTPEVVRNLTALGKGQLITIRDRLLALKEDRLLVTEVSTSRLQARQALAQARLKAANDGLEDKTLGTQREARHGPSAWAHILRAKTNGDYHTRGGW
ncbi:MAG TPA: hypothetical protein VJB02_02110, partial [Coxiellaceae bacterium]|nr:hypothetical protein [Coxiellaceae bacterium]